MLRDTNRLIIEYFNITDISDWAKIESDAEVKRFVDFFYSKIKGACGCRKKE